MIPGWYNCANRSCGRLVLAIGLVKGGAAGRGLCVECYDVARQSAKQRKAASRGRLSAKS